MAPRKKNDDFADLKSHIDSRFGELNEKFTSLDVRMADANVTLKNQQYILDEHVRRTNLLEEKLERTEEALEEKLDRTEETLERRIEDRVKAVESSLAPIKRQGAIIEVVFKIVKVGGKILIPVAGVLGLGAGLVELLKVIFG